MVRFEKVVDNLTAGLLLGDRLSRIAASLCEQRSYLPGDVEWTSKPEGDYPEGTGLKEITTEGCGTCRRTWASRRRRHAVSGLPGELAEEMGGARYSYHPQEVSDNPLSSCLPGDETGLNETPIGTCSEEEYDKLVARIASDEATYRYDPKHHRRPLGPGWWRTDSGWSKAETDKPGPKPKQQG